MTVEVVGDEPLVDGMKISVRMRRDFTVADAEALLTGARRVYAESHPGTTEEEAQTLIVCAADAIFAVLEHAGILGDPADRSLGESEADGLIIGGQRSQVTCDEPDPLLAGWDCFRTGDVFALPDAD